MSERRKRNRPRKKNDAPGIRQRQLTDLSDCQWMLIHIVLLSSLGLRYLLAVQRSPWSLRDYADALAYISRYKCRWNKMPREFPPVSAVYQFNRHLRNKRLFPLLRKILGNNMPFGLESHYKSVNKLLNDVRDTPGRPRTCDICPKCGKNAMRCYKTRRQGSRTVRYYQCEICSHKRMWMSEPDQKGWNGTFPPSATVCE